MLTLVFLLVTLCVSARDSLICPFVAEISLKKGGGTETDVSPIQARRKLRTLVRTPIERHVNVARGIAALGRCALVSPLLFAYAISHGS